VAEIGRQRSMSPFAAFRELSEQSRGAAVMLFHTYSGEPGNESALDSVLSRDYCLFETDAAIRSSGFPNPAALGTFPRVLGRYARERRLFPLEAAVRRMTSASAERFGLAGRGRLARGFAADVVVFDPETISDTTPAGARPAGRPVGIEHVFVNGVHAVDCGSAQSGRPAGRVLRT
jgi:N-acyl-D-amino-acid deacylase